MEQLHLGSQLDVDSVVVEQLREQLQRQDERVKQLVTEREVQSKGADSLAEELKQQQEKYQTMLCRSDSSH